MSDLKEEEIDYDINPEFLKLLQKPLEDYQRNIGSHTVKESAGGENPLEEVLMGESIVTDNLPAYRKKRLSMRREGTDMILPENYVIDLEDSETDNPWLQDYGL